MPVLCNSMIVLIILLGDDDMNVLMMLYLASSSQIIINKANISSWTRSISSFLLFNFFRYSLCSLLYIDINVLPYGVVVGVEFLALSIIYGSSTVC